MRHHDSANPTEGPAPEGRLGEAISRLLAILASDDMRRWRPRMAIAFLITLASKGFAVASPIAFGEGVNVLTRGVSNGAMASGLFWSAAIMFLAYGLLRFASTGAPQLRDAIFAPVSQDAQRLTAVQGFAHVQTLSLSFHQTKRTGAMNRIIDRGANAVDFLLRFLVFNILPALVELSLAAIVAAVLYGWAFSVIIVVAVIAYAVITGLMTEWRVKLRRQMNEADTEVNARAVDTLTNFETVKAFAAEQREADRFDTAKKRYAEAASTEGLDAILESAGCLDAMKG